ncbi:MAG TPA: alpha/beta hydrolase-fold protein [Lysobacter sp.]|nr:alpha/beta hydrolase-fold protein [Lysobacter sp.]
MRNEIVRMMHRRWCAVLCLSLSAMLPAWAAELAPPHETLRIDSKAMAETRRINVYLPPEYDRQSNITYPVLYMPDGGEQEDFPHVAAAVDRLTRSGEIKPMLVVGIENTQRRRDMTGPTQVENDRKIAPQVGGSAAFRRFIATELLPVVHARYRVNDEAAIIGESLAGLFIVETMFVQPDLFDTYIALDPSLWWNAEHWPKQVPERLPGLSSVQMRLYLASGNAESTNALQVGHMADALRAHAGPALHWQYELRPELRHDTIYRGLEEPLLRALFASDAVSTDVSRDSAGKSL